MQCARRDVGVTARPNGTPARSASARRPRSDLDYIFSETGSKDAADRAIDLIVVRFSLLTRWPRIGRVQNELRRGLRSHPAGDYLIFYRIEGAGIVILRVLHGHRDIQVLFRRRQRPRGAL